MAVTLLEAAKLMRGEEVRRAVVEIFGSSTQLLAQMPFENINGNSISFIQEDTPGAMEFRSVNSSYTEGSGTVSRINEPLVICGGDVDVDRFMIETGNESLRSTQEAGKIKRLGQLFVYKVIKGDQTSDPNEFSGLQARLAGTSQTVTNATNGAGLSLAKLDEMIDKVDGPNKRLVMSKAMARKFKAAARPVTTTPPVAGDVLYGTGWTEFGTGPQTYDGIPIVVVDDNDALYTTLGFAETCGGSSVCTSVYCVALAEGYFTGIQNSAPMVDDLGMLQTKPSYRTRIEWYASICLWHPRAAARLEGITDAAITA